MSNVINVFSAQLAELAEKNMAEIGRKKKKNLQSSLCQYKMENSWSAWHCTAEELWQLSVKTGRNKGI